MLGREDEAPRATGPGQQRDQREDGLPLDEQHGEQLKRPAAERAAERTREGSSGLGLPMRTRLYRNLGFGARLLVPGGPCGCLAAFNVAFAACMFAFFLFNTTKIFENYFRDLSSPPTRLSIDFNELVDLPQMVYCLADADQEITELKMLAVYPNEAGEAVGCLVGLVPRDEGGAGANTTMDTCSAEFEDLDLRFVRIAKLFAPNDLLHCVVARGIPGWSKLPGVTQNLANRVSFAFRSQYKDRRPRVGQGYFFVQVDSDVDIDDGDSLGALLGASSAEGVFGAGASTTASVEMSRISYYEGQELLTYALFRFFVSAVQHDVEPNATSVTSTFDIRFSDPRILHSEQYRPSFSVAFGALGGWLGLLSDGWGLMSILFLLEKLYMVQTGQLRQWYWWVPVLEERQATARG